MSKSSIWPTDTALSGPLTLGQSGSGSNGNEEVLHIPQISEAGVSLSDVSMSKLDLSLKVGSPLKEMQSVYSKAHAEWAQIIPRSLVCIYSFKTVPQPPYSPDLTPSDFCLFPKLKGGCHYETIEEMKKAVMKVIDTVTQEDFHGAFLRLLEQHNKCIIAGGNYFEGD